MPKDWRRDAGVACASQISRSQCLMVRAWVRRHLGDTVEVRCCLSKEKYKHCRPGDILIDDWEKYRALWVEAGGIWITHRSAEQTVEALQSLSLGPPGKQGLKTARDKLLDDWGIAEPLSLEEMRQARERHLAKQQSAPPPATTPRAAGS